MGTSNTYTCYTGTGTAKNRLRYLTRLQIYVNKSNTIL